jgi:hypothetical protein
MKCQAVQTNARNSAYPPIDGAVGFDGVCLRKPGDVFELDDPDPSSPWYKILGDQPAETPVEAKADNAADDEEARRIGEEQARAAEELPV